MVRAIVEVVCQAQPGSDIASDEQRHIAAYLVDWVLDTDINSETPDAAATAEHAIGLVAAEIFMSEAGDELTARNDKSRDEIAGEIRDVAHQLAARADVAARNTDAQSISRAIGHGIRVLRRIYGTSGT